MKSLIGFPFERRFFTFYQNSNLLNLIKCTINVLMPTIPSADFSQAEFRVASSPRASFDSAFEAN